MSKTLTGCASTSTETELFTSVLASCNLIINANSNKNPEKKVMVSAEIQTQVLEFDPNWKKWIGAPVGMFFSPLPSLLKTANVEASVKFIKFKILSQWLKGKMVMHHKWKCRIQCSLFQKHWLLGKWTCDSSITRHNTYCLAGGPCQCECLFPSLSFSCVQPSEQYELYLTMTLQKTEQIQFSSFQFNSTHFISTRSSPTQFSPLALYVVHSHSLIFSLPEPCNLLPFSTAYSSVSFSSGRRFIATSTLPFSQVYAHSTKY